MYRCESVSILRCGWWWNVAGYDRGSSRQTMSRGWWRNARNVWDDVSHDAPPRPLPATDHHRETRKNISCQQLQNIISAGNIQGSSSFMEIFAKLFQSFNKNILFEGVPAVRTFLSPRLTLVPDFWWLQECDVTEITDSRAKMVQVYVETPWYCDDTEWVEKYVNECSLVSVTN